VVNHVFSLFSQVFSIELQAGVGEKPHNSLLASLLSSFSGVSSGASERGAEEEEEEEAEAEEEEPLIELR
jgi:hypothetical protein